MKKRRSVINLLALVGFLLFLMAPDVAGQAGPMAPGQDTGGAGAGPYGNADVPFGAGQEAPTFTPPPSGPVPFAAGSRRGSPVDPDSRFPGTEGGTFPDMDTRTSGSAGRGTGTDSTFGGSGTGSFGLGSGAAEGTPGLDSNLPSDAPARFPDSPGSVPFGGGVQGMSRGGAGAFGGGSAGFPAGDAMGTFGSGMGGVRGGPGGGQR
jgi:hypothetical protein